MKPPQNKSITGNTLGRSEMFLFQNTFLRFINNLALLIDSKLKVNILEQVTAQELEEMSLIWETGINHLSAQVQSPHRVRLCFSWFTCWCHKTYALLREQVMFHTWHRHICRICKAKRISADWTLTSQVLDLWKILWGSFSLTYTPFSCWKAGTDT